MNNTKLRSDRALERAILAGMIIGTLLGVAVFVLTSIFPVWRPIMAPPEKAVEFLAYRNNAFDDNTLYIRAASGNIYAYRFSDYGASNVEWERVEQIEQEGNNRDCNFGNFPTPNPPGRIINQLEAHPCVLDSSSQVNYIILEDGGIWRWGKSVPEFEAIWALLELFLFVLIGAGLGGIAGALVGFAVVKFRKA